MLTKFAPVHVAIRRSFFYDELPEEWRELYCEYVGIDRAVMEHIMLTAVGDLHFILHDIEKPTKHLCFLYTVPYLFQYYPKK